MSTSDREPRVTVGSTHHRDPRVVSRRRLPLHSLGVPDDALVLDGDWAFRHWQGEAPDDGWQLPDADRSSFGSLSLPASWSVQGHGIPIVVRDGPVAVRSLVDLAEEVGVPEFVLAFFGASLGTSAPEIAVDLTALARGAPQIALGDALGSSLVDATLSIGIGPPRIKHMIVVTPAGIITRRTGRATSMPKS